MEALGWFVVGSFAAWIITFSIAISPDMEGPFYIYTGIRRLARAEFMPKLIKENAGCYICTSFYAAMLVSLFLPVYSGKSVLQAAGILFVFTYGIHGAVVFWFRWLRNFYAIGPDES